MWFDVLIRVWVNHFCWKIRACVCVGVLWVVRVRSGADQKTRQLGSCLGLYVYLGRLYQRFSISLSLTLSFLVTLHLIRRTIQCIAELGEDNGLLTRSVQRWFWAWQCSPTENCVVLLQGFNFFSLFNYVSALNLKITHPSSVLDGMPVANPISPAEEVAGFQYLRRQCGNTCPEYWQLKGSFFIFFFWRTEKHWKPGYMVSCRTVQGQKKCAKRQGKPAPDRAR
jgi:hypothetical protein